MILKKITTFLEDFAPLQLQEAYDNSGLILGSHNQEVVKALITLDITEDTVEEALKTGSNLIIAHHPIIFKGLKRLNGNNLVENVVIKAIKNDIAIYAIHTNLDNVPNGVNKILADKLGILNTRILSPRNGNLSKIVCFCPTDHLNNLQKAIFEAGAGHIGDYDSCSYYTDGKGTFKALPGSNPFVGKHNTIHHENEYRLETIVPEYLVSNVVTAIHSAHPYEEPAYDIYKLQNTNHKTGSGLIGELKKEMDCAEFLKFVKTQLGAEYIKHNKLIKRKVKKVAICGGSGSFLIDAAERQKADIFITADVKYHDFFEHTGKMTIADAGHFETEQPVKELIYSLLKKKFPTFALQISETSANPIEFL